MKYLSLKIRSEQWLPPHILTICGSHFNPDFLHKYLELVHEISVINVFHHFEVHTINEILKKCPNNA